MQGFGGVYRRAVLAGAVAIAIASDAPEGPNQQCADDAGKVPLQNISATLCYCGRTKGVVKGGGGCRGKLRCPLDGTHRNYWLKGCIPKV